VETGHSVPCKPERSQLKFKGVFVSLLLSSSCMLLLLYVCQLC